SSRRRHTRFSRDWSSDVCSSDLGSGDYIITARYYRNGTVIYSKQATLKIEDEGNYVFDLLLYPVSENPVTGTVEDKSGYDNDVKIGRASCRERVYSWKMVVGM